MHSFRNWTKSLGQNLRKVQSCGSISGTRSKYRDVVCSSFKNKICCLLRNWKIFGGVEPLLVQSNRESQMFLESSQKVNDHRELTLLCCTSILVDIPIPTVDWVLLIISRLWVLWIVLYGCSVAQNPFLVSFDERDFALCILYLNRHVYQQ